MKTESSGLPIKYLIELLLLGAIWGSSFMLMRITAPEFGIWAVVELRALLATLVLLPFVIAKQQLGDIRIFAKPILVVALTNTAIPFSLFTYGSLHLPSALTALLNGTAPMFGALLAWLWLKESMTHLAKLGFVCGFIGVYLISYETLNFQGISLLPVLACLGATFGYGYAICYIKQHLSQAKPLAIASRETCWYDRSRPTSPLASSVSHLCYSVCSPAMSVSVVKHSGLVTASAQTNSYSV